MYKKVFLDHWIDWTIAIILMVFIGVWGEVEKFAAEQDTFASESIAASSDALSQIRHARL